MRKARILSGGSFGGNMSSDGDSRRPSVMQSPDLSRPSVDGRVAIHATSRSPVDRLSVAASMSQVLSAARVDSDIDFDNQIG